jgi:hypothetical protein
MAKTTTKSQESISLRVGSVLYTIKKLLTRATTLIWISPQSKVCTQSYEIPKSRKSQFWEFRDSQNDIWVPIPWLGIEYTIRGKVVASPSLIHGESCESMFAHGLSMHQKCSNYALTNLLFGLCRFM